MACVSSSNLTLHGTALNNHDGSSFSLYDEKNSAITEQTHFGDVYLMTFLFTNCTSLCPLVTSNIKQAIERSEETRNISVLIVSVDPERDTLDSRMTFKEKWGLSDNWSYLNGSTKDLQNIWKDFYVSPHKSAVKNISGQLQKKYDVIHTSPVFIIDRNGRPAAVHTNPIEPNLLYEDIILISNR